MATTTLQEKLDKIKSPGLQSQVKTAVLLQAVETTLEEQNASQSPTGYFAALLALLNQAIEHGSVDAQLAAPAVYLLDVVTPFVPPPLLRAKFTQILGLLAPVLQNPGAEPILVRSVVGCIESLLLPQESTEWDLSIAQVSPRRAVTALLSLALDPRPKVRKRAQDALKRVLQNPPPSPLLDHPAADMCAHTALTNIEHAITPSSENQKQNKSTDATNNSALIHALQLIKIVAVASAGWPSKKIEPLCELLLRIAKFGNEYMTMVVFEIFEAIFNGLADELASSKLPRIIEIISDLRPAVADSQLAPPWLAVLCRGTDACARSEPDENFHRLPELFHIVVAFLESHAAVVRVSAAECLISFLAKCVPDRVLAEPSVFDDKTLENIAKVGVSLLSVRYQAAWLQSFHVLGAMLDAFRWKSYPVLLNVVKLIGDIRSTDSFANKKEADAVLGKAIKAMGPETVLNLLPLNLSNPSKKEPGRVWMLPILRDYTSNTTLAHFRNEMVPLSEVMYQRVLDHKQAEKTVEIKIYETVVQQIWSTLPGYCDLPLDLTSAFDQNFAEMLASLLYAQVELRIDICRALKNLVESNKAVASIEDTGDEVVFRGRVSREAAEGNLAYLGQFSGNMLAVLFNVYTQTLSQTRGPILQTIDAFLSITSMPSLLETFERVSSMLSAELMEESTPVGSNKPATQTDLPPPTRNSLMDIIIAMSIYLPQEKIRVLCEIVQQLISRENDHQIQKKAYKLLARLAQSKAAEAALKAGHEDLHLLLVSSASKVSAPARRDRLVAIKALLPLIPDTALHFIPSLLSEVVISCKEINERARETAYDLLVYMGHRMHGASGAVISISKVPHMVEDAPNGSANLEEYFTMVSAGLAGNTPHLVSATVTALSRLVFEFRDLVKRQTLSDLLQTLDLFLTSKNREVVKSVLGFAKISVISLPTALSLERLPTLIPNLISWSHEHKGHFKSKVKHILERMIRKVGYDAVYNACPEFDRKLISNIRKSRERSKKKRQAEKNGAEGDSEDEEEKPRPKFDSGYEEALYSSESEDSDQEDKEPLKRKGGKGGNTYIVEDDDEPLDLLDRKALANISSTKPVQLRKPRRSKPKISTDGKLILGRDSDSEDATGPDRQKDDPMESGVGAYVQALNGKSLPRRGRGGKLKFSNKKVVDAAEDDEVADGPLAAKSTAGSVGRGGIKAAGTRGQLPGGRRRRGGKGGFASGRRGLGEEKRRGPVLRGGIRKSRGQR